MARFSFTLVHAFPPFSERNIPPSSASTIAQTRSVFTGDTATPMRPRIPLGIPEARLRSVHVSPPSVDLKSPLPGPPLSKLYGDRFTSQNAAYKTRELPGSMAR